MLKDCKFLLPLLREYLSSDDIDYDEPIVAEDDESISLKIHFKWMFCYVKTGRVHINLDFIVLNAGNNVTRIYHRDLDCFKKFNKRVQEIKVMHVGTTTGTGSSIYSDIKTTSTNQYYSDKAFNINAMNSTSTNNTGHYGISA